MDDVSDVSNVGRNGHTPAGKFARGNRYGMGNPVARRIHELRRATLEAETPERAVAVLARMHELALEGDVGAARLYLDTVIGKAPTAVELSGPEGERLGGVDVATLQAVILSALAGPKFAEARIALADALHTLSTRDADRG